MEKANHPPANRHRHALGAPGSKYGFGFIAPMLIGFSVFVIAPLAATVYLSFCDYSLIKGMAWCGWDNYIKLFTRDATFVVAVKNTLYFTALLIPANLALCLGLAMLLHKISGVGFFRTAIFTP